MKKCLRNREGKGYESLNRTLFLPFSVFDLVLKEIIIVLKLCAKLIKDCSLIIYNDEFVLTFIPIQQVGIII